MTNKELLLGGVLAALIASIAPLIWQSISHIKATPATISVETNWRSNHIDIFISNNSDETVDIIKVHLFATKSYTEDKIYVGPSKVYTTDSGEVEILSEPISEFQLRVMTHQTIKAHGRDRILIYLPNFITINTDKIRAELIDSAGFKYVGRGL
jgi:hypothetical protein